MLHKMKLQKSPFERIKNGTKTIEFRLYEYYSHEKEKQYGVVGIKISLISSGYRYT